MKVVIFGASGILGQHMRLCTPPDVTPIWVRHHSDSLHIGLDLTNHVDRTNFLLDTRPDVIVNLAGESRPDVVERQPESYQSINAGLPGGLAAWCHTHNKHLIQVSTQAVFNGKEPPYSPASVCNPSNLYGCQKLEAEFRVRQFGGDNWTIVRPTFVLGVRPMPAIGRSNPIEQILDPKMWNQPQVYDRHFSVSFAWQVAEELWKLALGEPQRRIIHIGSGRLSRYELANRLVDNVESTTHDSFLGLAQRPVDTTYDTEFHLDTFNRQLMHARDLYNSRECMGHSRAESIYSELPQRARELSIFTGQTEQNCLAILKFGFNYLHKAVTEHFRAAKLTTDDEILEWYRTTDKYIWELSAYHADLGFNYGLMCDGIITNLIARGKKRVLCLGDGIGDLTISCAKAGLDPTYHDLFGSVTAKFAETRFLVYGITPQFCFTGTWEPEFGTREFDAVVSLDFLEHVTDVPKWAETIHRALKPNGLFCSWDAFGCGSGPDGAIPMHLARNDRFAKEWDDHLAGLGFEQESDDWYRKVA